MEAATRVPTMGATISTAKALALGTSDLTTRADITEAVIITEVAIMAKAAMEVAEVTAAVGIATNRKSYRSISENSPQ
jgi:hypothetical protein